MNAIKDLLASERGLLCLVILVAATVLAGLAKITYAEWREFVTYIFGTYVVGKTATGVAAVLKGKPAEAPAPATGNGEGA